MWVRPVIVFHAAIAVKPKASKMYYTQNAATPAPFPHQVCRVYLAFVVVEYRATSKRGSTPRLRTGESPAHCSRSRNG